MNALANCPIVASEDLEKSDYGMASKSDINRLRNARRRAFAQKSRTSMMDRPPGGTKRKSMTRPLTAQAGTPVMRHVVSGNKFPIRSLKSSIQYAEDMGAELNVPHSMLGHIVDPTEDDNVV